MDFWMDKAITSGPAPPMYIFLWGLDSPRAHEGIAEPWLNKAHLESSKLLIGVPRIILHD